METASWWSESAPAGEPAPASPAGSSAPDPPSSVSLEADAVDEPNPAGDREAAGKKNVPGDAEDGAGGLAARAAALLDAGAADVWLTSRAGGAL